MPRVAPTTIYHDYLTTLPLPCRHVTMGTAATPSSSTPSTFRVKAAVAASRVKARLTWGEEGGAAAEGPLAVRGHGQGATCRRYQPFTTSYPAALRRGRTSPLHFDAHRATT